MSTDLDANFNEQFININIRLKRRFMRKPNMSECVKEFVALAVRCEHADQPAFAGHAYVGAAKCEASVGNSIEETDFYLMAARQFMKAEKKLHSLKFYSPDRENLEAAIGCYLTAFHKVPETTLMRGSILMELSALLISLGHNEEAITIFEQAINHVKETGSKIVCLKNKIDLEIKCDKFNQALATANSLADTSFSSEFASLPDDYLTEIQIYRILLSLLVKPTADNEPASLKQLFTDLMNDNDSDKIPFSPDLKLKMQSIISTTMSGDIQSLVAVTSETVRHLSQPQEVLLQTLISKERAEHLSLT